MPDHAAAIAAAAARFRASHGEQIRAEVATWPELTGEQKTALALILAGGDHVAA